MIRSIVDIEIIGHNVINVVKCISIVCSFSVAVSGLSALYAVNENLSW